MVEDRYSRFRVLPGIGKKGLRSIRKARVAVVGIGGLGTVSATQFAALGVGYLRIVDRDVIELSNLQRQWLYTTENLGMPKVEVAQQRLQEINPDVEVEALALSVTEATAERVVEGMTVIVDGLDRFKPRYAINRACVRHNVPYVFAGALGAVGNMSTIIPKETPCLECFLSDIDDTQPTCATVGIYPTIVGVIANLQVHEALRLIMKKPPILANQLLMFDIERFRTDILSVEKYDACPICGTEAELSVTTKDSDLIITELCSEKTYLVHSIKAIPIDIERIATLLRKKYQIIAQSALGIQIQLTSGVEVSIVGEGNILIKGVESDKKARAIYQQMLSEIQRVNP